MAIKPQTRRTKPATSYRRRRPSKPSKPRRRPSAGLLDPGLSIRIAIDPPLADNEQPVVLTPSAGDVLITEASTTHAIVTNQTDRIAAYMFTIAPRLLIQAAAVPWKRVARDLGTAIERSGLLDRFARLLGR